MTPTLRIQSLPFNNVRTYAAATLFILGNLIVPQLFHLVPQGGATWLPIYFFTLVGAYIFGWRVGLLTALASPLLNSMLFAMPAAQVLPAIMLKSVLLGLIAGAIAQRFRNATLPLLAAVVLGYQLVGTLGEWMICGDWMLACQDFRIGIPGMVLQVFGGWIVINCLSRK